MKLSLSGRIIEVDYKYCHLSVEQFLKRMDYVQVVEKSRHDDGH